MVLWLALTAADRNSMVPYHDTPTSLRAEGRLSLDPDLVAGRGAEFQGLEPGGKQIDAIDGRRAR